jgi:hypothetical protein
MKDKLKGNRLVKSRKYLSEKSTSTTIRIDKEDIDKDNPGLSRSCLCKFF